MSERRSAPRFDADVPVVLRHTGGRHLGLAADASERGLAVLLGSSIATGTDVAIEIQHPAGKIQVSGCVVRVTPRDEPKWRYRVAIELDAPAADIARLFGARAR